MPSLLPYKFKTKTEAGLDEAGRGCFAGPVVAAAVILPKDFYHPLLNDSKLLSVETRNALRLFIEQHAIDFAVAFVNNEVIDSINILQASYRAMHLAIDQLKRKPARLLVDGNRFLPYGDIPFYCQVKGDSTYSSIAAASVLAKTYRDEYMLTLHDEFPQYGWNSNKGYGTLQHRRAIGRYGICRYHRKSFSMKVEEKISLQISPALHG